MTQEFEIRRYGPRVRLAHMLLVFFTIPLIATGLLLLRDWFMHEYHIRGDPLIISPEWNTMLHQYVGLGLLIVGLFHVLTHMTQKEKSILSKNTLEDFKATTHALLYIFHFAKRQERGDTGKYTGTHRMIYLAAFYTFGMAGLTALFIYLDLFGEIGVLMHVLTGILAGLVVGFRLLLVIRKHDGQLAKCLFITGKLPSWYAKKNYPLWYKDNMGSYSSPNDVDFPDIDDVPSEGVGTENTGNEERSPNPGSIASENTEA